MNTEIYIPINKLAFDINKFNIPFLEEDEIAINALTINYISSAKTLIESIDNCIKNINKKTTRYYI